MLKNSVLVLVLLIAGAAFAGDPLDGTEIRPADMTADYGCALAIRYPDCVPCWTTCIYAMVADAWTGGGWDWGW